MARRLAADVCNLSSIANRCGVMGIPFVTSNTQAQVLSSLAVYIACNIISDGVFDAKRVQLLCGQGT